MSCRCASMLSAGPAREAARAMPSAVKRTSHDTLIRHLSVNVLKVEFQRFLASAIAWVQGSLWCLDERAEWRPMALQTAPAIWRVDTVQERPHSQAASCNEHGLEESARWTSRESQSSMRWHGRIARRAAWMSFPNGSRWPRRTCPPCGASIWCREAALASGTVQ